MEDNSYNNFLDEDGKFDEQKFNRAFADYIDNRKEERDKVGEKTEVVKIVPPHEEPVHEILKKTKKAVYETFDDITNDGFNSNTLSKDNRLFYLGVALLIAMLVIITVKSFFPGKTQEHSPITIKLVN